MKKRVLFILLGLVINSASAQSTNKNEILVPMDLAQWHFKGNSFSCYLTANFSGGKFYFRSLPGNKNTSHVEYDEKRILNKNAALYIQSPPWHHRYYERFITNPSVVGEKALIFHHDASQLFAAVAQGQWLQLRHDGKESSATSATKHILPTVRIQSALASFEQCRTSLPKMSYQDARTLTLPFAVGQQGLNAAQQAQLQAFLSYVVLDETIERILVDGHTDNTGEAFANLSLSRQRAEHVATFLREQGVAAEMIQVRAHGERYPTADNRQAAGRDKNRRVVVRLVRQDESLVHTNPSADFSVDDDS